MLRLTHGTSRGHGRRMGDAGKKIGPDLLDRAYWGGVIKMSLSKFFILCVLHYRPMHGYEIAKQVSRTTNGCCTPTEGTIYPVLKQFEEGGYVNVEETVVSGRTRKTYTLTETGRAAFAVAMDEWMAVTACLTACQGLVDRPPEGSADAGRDGASCC